MDANLQRDSDCPADWCKCEYHSLSPQEEEEEEEQGVKASEEKECVNVSLEKRLNRLSVLNQKLLRWFVDPAGGAGDVLDHHLYQ